MRADPQDRNAYALAQEASALAAEARERSLQDFADFVARLDERVADHNNRQEKT